MLPPSRRTTAGPAGLVTSTQGADARTREVALTERARAIVPFLEAALARRPFHDRIVENLAEAQGPSS